MNKTKRYHFLLLSFLTLLLSYFPLESYGILQGRSRYRDDQEERAFMESIYHTYSPFYTGPLLAPSANVVPKGKVNVQPYLFWQKTYGVYTRTWDRKTVASTVSLQPLVIVQYGLTDFLDANLTCQGFYKQSGTQHNFNYGDTQFTLGLQLLKQFLHTAWPACQFEAGVVFPTGTYHERDPFKNGTDITGKGSYVTTLSLNFQKNFNRIFKSKIDPLSFHPFLFRLSFGYDIAAKVRVKGYNTYGGSRTTDGKVKPGNTFTTVFAWEYSFTEKWVFATDWQYQFSPKTTFSGRDGGAPMGGPSNQTFSVAPAIEFNINPNMGVLGGVWFSFAGRNSQQFVTGIISMTALF